MLTILLIVPVLLLLLGGGFAIAVADDAAPRRGRAKPSLTGRGYLEKRPRPK